MLIKSLQRANIISHIDTNTLVNFQDKFVYSLEALLQDVRIKPTRGLHIQDARKVLCDV